MSEAVRASGAEVVTVSIRRISLHGHGSDTVARLKGARFLPNTAGCETARDAVMTAELAREALGTNWIKVEVIGDRETLYRTSPRRSRPPASWSIPASSCCPIATTIRWCAAGSPISAPPP